MKGLLLKDFYMARKYCRAYLFLSVLFIGLSAMGEAKSGLFYVFYPCLLAGMIPTNLLAYDERSRWDAYSGALPYSKAQLVSAKYLIGLIAQVLALVLIGVAQAVKMYRTGTFVWNEYLTLLLVLLLFSCVATAVCLPFMFIFGVEKGRIAYYVVLGLTVASIMVVSVGVVSGTDAQPILPSGGLLPLLCLAGIALYALSWYLSIAFYRNRDAKA